MKKPTFLLKPSAYKTNELYAIIPDDGTGDMNVTGYVGNGTRVNPQGFIETVATDTPRIDHFEKPGLLLEPTRINQFLQSETVSGNFSATNITLSSDDSITLYGTIGADKLIEQSASNGYISKTTTLTTGTNAHTHSLFVKFQDSEYFVLRIKGNVNLNTSDIGMDRYGVTTIVADAQSQVGEVGSDYYGDGWWRIWVTVTFSVGDTGATWDVYPSGLDADMHGNAWVWGFQIEEGVFPTSYIPTTTVAVTRTYDLISTSTIVADGFIGLATGAFFVDLNNTRSLNRESGNLHVIGAAGGRLAILKTSGQTELTVEVISTDATTDEYLTTQKRNKVLFNIAGDNVDVWVNGTKQISTGKDFFLTNEVFGLDGRGFASKIYEVAMFDKLLTDTEAQAITK